MTPPYEDLSRLLAGELPPDRAEALRARIAAEPEVAAAWEALQRLPAELAALPEEAPPAALDARVLGARRPVAARARTRLWLAPAALAAAALCWLLLRHSPAAITIVEGEQWVRGRADVLAATVPVEVDGIVRIRVEPAPPAARGSDGEEDGMKTIVTGAAGALAGAVVTVAVIEGRATLRGDEGAPVELRAGDAHTIAPRRAKVALPPRTAPVPGQAPAERIAALEAEVEALRTQLAEAEFTKAVAAGQLAAEQGAPSTWPEDVPPGLAAKTFEAALRESLAANPGFELTTLDCSEYPCMAMIDAGGADWEERAKALPKAIEAAAGAESAAVWLAIMGGPEGETDGGTVGIALLPPDIEHDENLRTRTDWRGRNLLHEAGGR